MPAQKELSYREFHIQQYGEGSPQRLMIGGLAYSPDDYSALATQLPGTNLVVDNPMHTGAMEWDLATLRERYGEIVEEHHCTDIIGHSLGCLDAVAVTKEQHEQIQRVVLLTPPLNPTIEVTGVPRLPPDESEKFGLLETLISDLCRDMPLDEYREFLVTHFTLYGSRMKLNYKKGMPKPKELIHLIQQLIADLNVLRKKCLAVLGKQDIWYPGQDSVPTFDSHVEVLQIDGAHYLHKTQTGTLAERILAL